MKRNASEISVNLINKLWETFLRRVSFARTYVDLVNRRDGRIIHDHLGFRTLLTHTGEQPEGIAAISHIFNCLGYSPKQKYNFPKKHLKAVCYESETTGLPTIFVSQLNVQELPLWARNKLTDILKDTSYLISVTGIELLGKLKADGNLTAEAADILEEELVKYFRRPWKPPARDTVIQLNDVSHYAAWVLLHGNRPSHFAVLINQQDVPSWPDLETTCDALKKHGLPMKEKIEGEKGSRLQQSATFAVKEDVVVGGMEGLEKITWTYAYLELIRRGYIQENDQTVLFRGFIESQECQMYNMTVTLDN
jgi:hypothetical protein